MIYIINGEKVTKNEFYKRLEIEIENYIPYSKYWTPKNKILEELSKKREFSFPVYHKRGKELC